MVTILSFDKSFRLSFMIYEINPFHATVFFYPLENHQKIYAFLMFSGSIKREQCYENWLDLMLLSYNLRSLSDNSCLIDYPLKYSQFYHDKFFWILVTNVKPRLSLVSVDSWNSWYGDLCWRLSLEIISCYLWVMFSVIIGNSIHIIES